MGGRIPDAIRHVLCEDALGASRIPRQRASEQFDVLSRRDATGVAVSEAEVETAMRHAYDNLRLVVEPGRAISGHAGVTLHRVQSVSVRTDGRAVVTVDGSHPQSAPAANYTVALANRHPLGPTRVSTVVGRDGSVIADDLDLPDDVHSGDLLATACTGAYHHSMASNYNMVGRPPLIGVHHGRTTQLVRRETVADLLARDLGWTTPSAPHRSGCDALLHGE